MGFLKRYITSSWAERNNALDDFKSSEYGYILLMTPEFAAVEKKYEGNFGPPFLDEALPIAQTETRFQAIALLCDTAGNEIISKNLYTTARRSCEDDAILLTKEAVKTVGYFNKIDGKYGVLEYLARVNRASGFVPDVFNVFNNTSRYIKYYPLSEKVSTTSSAQAYNKSLVMLRQGLGISTKVKP